MMNDHILVIKYSEIKKKEAKIKVNLRSKIILYLLISLQKNKKKSIKLKYNFFFLSFSSILTNLKTKHALITKFKL